MKPFSQACENNSAAILAVLQRLFRSPVASLLEIGSGTGQHAAYCASQLRHLQWQTSDLQGNHAGINQWIDSVEATNIARPLLLDVLQQDWGVRRYDGVFSANTLHILSWANVEALFNKLPTVLNGGAIVAIYGPFNYQGEYTSESNEQFDHWLKARSPEHGIRDSEKVDTLAQASGLTLIEDNPMPANNRLRVWRYEG